MGGIVPSDSQFTTGDGKSFAHCYKRCATGSQPLTGSSPQAAAARLGHTPIPKLTLQNPFYCAAQPPSMFQATPRTLLPAGEQKKTASAPSSSGVVNCIEGSFSPSSSLVASSLDSLSAAALASTCFCTSGVSTQPGQMALQVTPVVAF